MRQLHRVLNAAARLIVRKRKFDSISSTIHDVLHWPVATNSTAYPVKTVHTGVQLCAAPVYVSTMCQTVSENLGRRCLRLAARGDLAVPATRTECYSPRGFAVVGLSTWNSLPTSLRDQSLTMTSFCRQLKTFLFSTAYTSSARS